MRFSFFHLRKHFLKFKNISLYKDKMKDEFTEVYEKFTKEKQKIPTDISFKLQFMHDYIADKQVVAKLT